MIIQPASGTKDLNPQQVEENQFLLSKLSNVYKKWGYEEIAPPKIERIKTLIAGGGILRKDILKLVVDEPLGLRPEMTASIARFASTRFSKKERPLRLWANGTVFKSREESDGKIAIEESLQSGVELFGSEGMEIEIELLYLLLESLKVLDINKTYKPKLLIGHTLLMQMILAKLGNQLKEKVKEALINFDLIEINNFNISESERNTLLMIQKLRGSPENTINSLRNIYGNNNILESLERLFKIIKPISMKYNVKIQLDPTYKPTYDLYTGTIFQIVCEGKGSPVVIARGGRYDELAKKFNKEANDEVAGGFTFYIDNTRELSHYVQQRKESRPTKVLVAFGPNRKIEDALERQKSLHDKGYIAVIELQSCKTQSEAQALLSRRNCEKLEWINK